MDEIILAALAGLILLGTSTAIIEKNPFNKLLSLSLITAGIIPFIIDRGYLDVAIAIALIVPLSTIIILMAMGREVPS